MKKLLLAVALFSFVAAANAGEPVTTNKKEVKSSCCKKDGKSCCKDKKETKASADTKVDTKAEKTTTEVKPTGTK